MTSNTQCPICLDNCTWKPLQDSLNPFPNNEVICPRCGEFEVEGGFVQEFVPEVPIIKEAKRGLASGWIRENSLEIMNGDKIKDLNNLKDITPLKKALKYLKNLSKDDLAVGKIWYIDQNSFHDKKFLSFAWVNTWPEHDFIKKNVLTENKGLLSNSGIGTDPITKMQTHGFYISAKGWEELDQPTNAESKQGFIAMSFEKALNNVDTAIRSAIDAAGYEHVIMKTFEHNNRIDDEIIAQIRKSRFVVTDLTHQNKGAYFEAGLALGIGIPVIWTCEKSEVDERKVHFDTRQFRLTIWEKEKLEDFKKALKNRIEATIGRGDKT